MNGQAELIAYYELNQAEAAYCRTHHAAAQDYLRPRPRESVDRERGP